MRNPSESTSQRFISSFVPRSVALADPLVATSQDAASDAFFAAVLFVDISDFTSMTERFERSGPDGVEHLTEALDRHFGMMIAKITDAGGEIENMLGDALLAYWPSTERDARQTVRDALVCAADLQTAMADQVLEDDTRLNVHAALVAGPVQGLHVGGHAEHRLYLLRGEPLDRISDLVEMAGAGELVVDATVREIMGGDMRHDAAGTGGWRFDGFGERAADPTQTPDRAAVGESPHAVHYLQQGLRQRLLAGHDHWLAELRNCTVTFISLSGLTIETGEDLETLQEIVLAMQQIVHDHGGAVQCLTMHDKGTVFYAAFGLPSLAHEDDAVRALVAMQKIHQLLGGFGCAPSIGVSRGMTYCGVLGSDAWRCYSVRGSVTNRAARLMAQEAGDILVDAAMEGATNRYFAFTRRDPMQIKGFDERVDTFALEHTLARSSAAETQTLFDRTAELDAIDSALAQFGSHDPPKSLLIEGNPGIGKTALLSAAEDLAASRDIAVLRGAAETLSLGAVYAAWRGVFQRLFEDHEGGTDLERVASILPPENYWQQRIPLLGPVLAFAVEDNELTQQMQGQTRADNTRELMRRVIEDAAMASPVVVVLDDCQWMDSASWRLVTELIEGGTQIVFILGMRTEREQAAEFVQPLIESYRVSVLRVSEIADEAVAKIVTRSIDATTVADPVVEFILARGGGNPFFTQELARALLEQGHITVTGGHCDLAPGTSDVAVEFPTTIEQVVVSRVDRLDPDLQLTLKAASVVGPEFQFDALLGIHPLQISSATCRTYTDELDRRDFTPQRHNRSELVYFFRHLISHGVVYGLLTFAQRRELHATTGTWIEQHVGTTSATSVVLAHHWTRAERPDKALPYLAEAGKAALDNGAYTEAQDFHRRAITICRERPELSDAMFEAGILFNMGETDTRLVQTESSHEYFVQGLARLGVRWPRTKVGYVLSLTANIARQLYHRARGVGTEPEQFDRPRERLLADGLEKFSFLFFFEQRSSDLLLATICGLNFSERANAHSTIRRLFAVIGLSLSIGGLHRLSDYYVSSVENYTTVGSTEEDLSYQFSYLAMHAIGHGRWASAHHHLQRSLQHGRTIGHKRHEVDVLSFTRSALFIQGDYVEGARANETYREAAIASGDEQHQYFMRVALGEFALRMSDVDLAARLFEEAEELLLPGYDMDKLHVMGMRAVVQHRLGDVVGAWRGAIETLPLIADVQPIGYYAMEAYAGIASLFLDHLEAPTLRLVSQAEIVKLARRALRGFDAFSKSFTVSRARYLSLLARLHALRGRHKLAHRVALQGLEAAEARAMTFDIAFAKHQLARSEVLTSGQRGDYLAGAESGYVELGLEREAALVRADRDFKTTSRSA